MYIDKSSRNDSKDIMEDVDDRLCCGQGDLSGPLQKIVNIIY